MTRIREVRFTRNQPGWVCDITFTFTSSRQLTDEVWKVESECCSLWFVAWSNARGRVKSYLAQNAAKRGERAAKGWRE